MVSRNQDLNMCIVIHGMPLVLDPLSEQTRTHTQTHTHSHTTNYICLSVHLIRPWYWLSPILFQHSRVYSRFLVSTVVIPSPASEKFVFIYLLNPRHADLHPLVGTSGKVGPNEEEEGYIPPTPAMYQKLKQYIAKTYVYSTILDMWPTEHPFTQITKRTSNFAEISKYSH